MSSFETQYKKARFFARLLDNQFQIAGVSFGIDPLVNLIPWVGDIIGALLSIYILKIAYEAKVSKIDLLKMVGNILLDFVVGAVPLIGVIFDVVYKANIRNLKILEKYLGKMKVDGKVVEGTILS